MPDEAEEESGHGPDEVEEECSRVIDAQGTKPIGVRDAIGDEQASADDAEPIGVRDAIEDK